MSNTTTIYGKSLRFWIGIAGVIISLLTIIGFLSQYSLYRFTVTGNEQYSIYTVEPSDSERYELQTILGITLVPRTSGFIEVNEGRSMARASLDDRRLIGITDRSITLSPQKAVSKLGRNNLGCNIKNLHGTYTYNCGSPSRIVKLGDLSRSQWENSIERELLPDAFYYAPYKDGLLSLGYIPTDDGGMTDKLRVEYIIPGTSQTTESSLAGVEFTPDDILTLHTDVSGGDSFVISNLTTGKIYFFENTASPGKSHSRTAHYIRISDIASCSLRQARFACYYGFSSQSPDGEEEKAARDEALVKRKGVGQIETYNFITNTSAVSTSERRVVDEICLTKDNAIVGISGADVFTFNTGSAEIQTSLLADNGIRVNCGNTSIYTTAKGIYIIEGNTSHLLFAVNRLNISSVTSFGNSIIFNAFVAPDETGVANPIAHTYQINPAKDHPGDRIEDRLPYTASTGLPILDMDYNDTILYIQPSYGIISDRQTGQAIVDEDSFNASRSVIEDMLESDDILNTGRQIIYSRD